MNTAIDPAALGRLRAAKAAANNKSDVRSIIAARDEVLARYSPMFQPNAIPALTEEVLRSFLYFENNKHWTGLNRQVNRICADMDATRAALADLVDESQPIETRMDPATAIKGMGKGIITAILHVAYPDRYGVWNTTSDASLVELGLMPPLGRGARFGERYGAINEVLIELAKAIEVDLWTLDAIWWKLAAAEGQESTGEVGSLDNPSPMSPNARDRSFALERHLQNYLFDNWDSLDIARDWEIYSEAGESDAGYEFTTPIGRIDLLAKHRTEPRWLVIELKRWGSSDEVVGQIMRYIGWIRAHHAEPGEGVEGLIIAREGDPKLHYAVSALAEVAFMSYEVEFRLQPGPSFQDYARP